MSDDSPLYLHVAVPRRLYRVFTYAVPSGLSGPWTPGMRVQVPFGKSILTGYIVAVSSSLETDGAPARLREISARLEDTPSIAPDLLSLAEWVAERYVAPLGQCLRLIFPGAAAATAKPRRPPHLNLNTVAPPPPTLAPAQPSPALLPLAQSALAALARHTPERVLLPVSTDELPDICDAAIQRTVDEGKSALVLVPEAGRATAIQVHGIARWGTRCHVYHGGLSQEERRQTWERIAKSEASIVIGTRSAVFAPLARLGLVIIDQEDHGAYKAENVPRFDARVVAAERARRAGAVLILASAHPSLDSVHATGFDPDTLTPPQPPLRVAPPITVADLRETPFGEIISPALSAAIGARLAAGKKVLLFLNRKGYSPVLQCRDCGRAVPCPACSVGWTFHKHESMLRCSHCGLAGKAPETCPACSGIHLVPSGAGTEALEETIRLRFPTARIARLERHRTGGDRANAAILALWQTGELDILIGTQLVVTSSPRPVASLVGLVCPDAALHLPAFQAAERAYHTLHEVIALADPRDAGSEIVIQTYMPQHHAIRALAERTPSIFYESELAARKMLGYPPFGRLIGLRVSGTKEDLVEEAATRWAALLRRARPALSTQDTSLTLEVLGPIPATPARVRERFRRQLVVKGADAAALRDAVRHTLAEMEKTSRAGGLRYDIDVDPQGLL